ncbi:hypothetical protein HanPSC8_Chr03g0129161 [Helianthus annuus]|nr:hypothetical protein HanPSC8_Chr03g0129161 [Helianthus annuus]
MIFCVLAVKSGFVHCCPVGTYLLNLSFVEMFLLGIVKMVGLPCLLVDHRFQLLPTTMFFL